MKLNADDLYDNPDTWVVHIDSDSMFTDRFHVNKFFTDDNRAIYLRSHYDQLSMCDKCGQGHNNQGKMKKNTSCTHCDGTITTVLDLSEKRKLNIRNGGSGAVVDSLYRWQYLTSQVIGENVMHEYMRRMPLLYKNRTITKAKEFIIEKHNKTIFEYLKNMNNFSEYNFLGAFCARYFKDDYKFVTPEKAEKLPFAQIQEHEDINNIQDVVKKHDMTIDNFNRIKNNVRRRS